MIEISDKFKLEEQFQLYCAAVGYDLDLLDPDAIIAARKLFIAGITQFLLHLANAADKNDVKRGSNLISDTGDQCNRFWLRQVNMYRGL